jgi:phage recombination protein Bet
MSSALVEAPDRPPGELAEVTYTREQVELIKRTICQDATDDELQLFLTRCAKTGLDPFMRQIYSIKRGGKHTIQLGIDGYRLIAQRTGECDGQDGPYWCGPDGVWREVWLEKGPPAAARLTVFRRGQSRGYTGTALWAEYGIGSSNDLVRQMPAGMLAKVAESLALRKAFPQELSGMYVEDEMAQAEAPPARREAAPAVAPEQLKQLLAEKNWPWATAVKGINASLNTAYSLDVHPSAMDQGHLADFVAWLRTQPARPKADAKPAAPPADPTADQLSDLLSWCGEAEGTTTEAQIDALFDSLKIGATGLDDLTAEQLGLCVRTAEAKVRAIKKAKAAQTPAPAAA